MKKTLLTCLVTLAFLAHSSAEDAVKIMLVGDSTTIGNVPRELAPDRPQLEGMIEIIGKAEGLPPLEVVNTGKGGETAKRLLGSKWYDEMIKPVKDVDYIVVRMGINDWFRCEVLERDFPIQMKALIAQLRKDHPESTVILATICRFMPDEECVQVNDLIRKIAADEKLDVMDIYTPYNQYLTENGPNALNVRQPYLSDIPESYHEFLKSYTYPREARGDKQAGEVVKVNDTSLDPLFGHIKS